MGFFSQDCHGCGHPLLSTYVTNSVNRWMQHAVVVRRSGAVYEGFYDGYGRLVPMDLIAGEMDVPVEGDDDWVDEMPAVVSCGWDDAGDPDGSGPTVWHRACWLVAGSPTDYRGESEGSADQGYFFEDPDHDMAQPGTKAALKKGRTLAKAVAERNRREEWEWAIEHDKRSSK